jgi:hypothetical protein
MPFFYALEELLLNGNIHCCGAFFTLLNLKGHPIAFSKRLESVSIDS